MRILLTGAASNISRAIVPRLRADGHDLVLHDIVPIPRHESTDGFPAIQGDIQAGIGLERAARGCDMVIHTPAWHGIHWREKTEADFWRLNVDGTFWTFQAAEAEGITRMVFLSSMAWHGHYDKYGFTKRVGEELCEYYRRNHKIRYVAIRPHDFTPWGNDYVNRYGARLLYGGVDREDVMECVISAVKALEPAQSAGAEPEGILANALRASAYTADQIAGWQEDPAAACERVFPGSRDLVAKYAIKIERKPEVLDLGEGAAQIGYTPKRHFGTFLEELRCLDAEVGQAGVLALQCPY